MKSLSVITIILILSAFGWSAYELYKLFNSEINFFELKLVPISVAFFTSTLLFGLSTRLQINKISVFYLIVSTLVLAIAVFTDISHVLLFKVESIVLLFFGVHAFRLLAVRKPAIFTFIYYLTALFLTVSIFTGSVGYYLQITQGILVIAASTCVLLSIFAKKFN